MVKLLLLIVFISACSLDNFQIPDGIEAETIEELNEWVFLNIEFVPDEENYTQEPEETLLKGTGDCEDQAVLLRELSVQLLGIYPQVVVLWSYNWGHAIILYNGMWYDPSYGTVRPENKDQYGF